MKYLARVNLICGVYAFLLVIVPGEYTALTILDIDSHSCRRVSIYICRSVCLSLCTKRPC